MSTAILYATLGALAGLPLGFGFAWCVDPKGIVMTVGKLLFAVFDLTGSIDALVVHHVMVGEGKP